MTRRLRLKPLRVLKHLFLIAVSFLSAFPFYWMLSSATNDTADIILGRILPGSHLLVNWANLTGAGKIGTAFFNSVRNAVVLTFLSLFISSMAGYGFVIFRDKWKNKVMGVLMLSMMIPPAATLIPMFRMFSQLGLINTLAGFMLPSIATVFLIFMFRQATQSFPYEIVQAARIDGLGEFNIFLRMFVPIMRPTYAAAAIVTFMNAWNSYLWPLVILQSPDQLTLPIYAGSFRGGYVLDYGLIMLVVTISTIPMLVIFFTLQRSFVVGILGSVK
ncbi:MAG TPA: carbohydrate ABC transporter permease [Clostridia bacterium]|nr:carbohydrate ABC transporter permease [Clostridia bacterium]